jgi:predicted ArsR family transcriptional regulator
MDPLGALSSLGDATRRRIYGVVAAAPAALTREEVAAQAGIGRTLAAYHLDRLADDGLLTVTRERRTGRSGPGAGRPAKLYARSEREVTVSIPPRDYHVAARLLADAAAADATGDTARALAGSGANWPPRAATWRPCCASAATSPTRTGPACSACATVRFTRSRNATPRSSAT